VPGYTPSVTIVAEADRRHSGRRLGRPDGRIADLAEAFGHDEIRISHEQNVILPHVRLDDLPAALRPAGGGGDRGRPISA
jgi:sulfite reductase (NADPH) hemoprotein beta-component